MFTTAETCTIAAICGMRVRALAANPVVTATTAWYAPAMDRFSGFDHKHPSRRPPSLT